MSQEIENQQQALNVLVQAAQVAQKRGVYSLDEAGLIAQAIAVFAPPEEEPTQEDFSSEAEGEDAAEEEAE